MNMKKFLLIILTLIYATVSSGITLNYHFCMGRLADVEFLNYAETCSSCGEKKEPSHCCTNETQYIKLAVDQNVHPATTVALSPVVIELLAFAYEGLLAPEADETTRVSLNSDVPPDYTSIPLYIHHCTYLI